MTGASTPLERLRQLLRDEVKRFAAEQETDVVTAFVYDDRRAQFHLPVGHGLRDPESFEDRRLAPRSGRVAGKVARERRAIIAEQVPGRSPMDGPFARREGIRSAAGYPLQAGDRVVGVLFVSYRDTHIFDDRERAKIEAEARRLAELIAAESLWDELGQLEPERLSGNPTLQTIAELACDAMGLSAAIWQLQTDGETLELVAGSGLTSRYLETRARVGDGNWLSRIVETGEVAELDLDTPGDDGRKSFQDAAREASWATALGVPVYSQGRICGVIEGLSVEASIDPADRDVLRHLAGLAGIAIENAQRDREVRVLGDVAQSLSQVPNFDRAMKAIVDGALRLTGGTSGGIRRSEGGKTFVLYSHTPERPEVPCGPPVGIAHDRHGGDASSVPKQVEVLIRVAGEWVGTLYVHGPHPFTDHHRKLLETLADQVSVTLGWSRLLLRASKKVERESARLSDQEKKLERAAEEVRRSNDPDFELVAIQLVDFREWVIQTVYGIGRAAEWVGLAKHYLEKDEQLRDIQADIALANPPRIEILTQYDPRFDKWIYKEFSQEKMTRIFAPLILARDGNGKVLEGQDLEDWLESWGTDGWTNDDKDRPSNWPDGRRQFVELDLPEVTWEIIGTVEAGYDDCQGRTVQPEQAVELAKSAARHAVRIYRTLLQHVFQTVVDHAVKIVGAEYAALHPDPHGSAPGPGGHEVGQVASGRVGWELIKHHPPRAGGLGQQAIKAGRALFVPDPSRGDDDQELSRTNPEVYARGIRAVAAIPFIGAGREPRDMPRDRSTGSGLGVLYVGFGAEPGGGVHRFTPEEIGWLELFANSAADAMRHATTYARMRDQARLLTNLHSVAERLVSIPEHPELLDHIAWGILNVLGADVVTIYQYVQFQGRFETPPAIAGRVLIKPAMDTAVQLDDTPALVVNQAIGHRSKGEPIELIYAERSRDHPLLDPDRPERETFVRRERIVSTAAIPLVTGKDAGQEIVGILFVNYRRPHSFPDAERKIIETLASTAAVAIKNGRLLGVFQDADHGIIASQDVDEVLDQVVKRAVEFTGAEYGEVRLFDPLRQALAMRYRFPSQVEGGAIGGIYLAHRTIEDWVLECRKPALVENYRTDSRCRDAGAPPGSECCVPLLHQERLLGTLRVVSLSPGAFQAKHQSVLVGFANKAVLALILDETRKRLKTNEKLSTMGGLTGTVLHRLKNDLLGITFHADRMKEAQGAGDIRKSLEMADKVEALTEAFRTQVSRIRDWSDPDRRSVSLREAVQRGREHVSIPASIRVGIDMPPELPPVTGDAELLTELFSILMNNAVEAMPAGGQLLVVGRRQGPPDASWIVVRVQDTGTGIDELTLERLFQPKHSAKRGGLGIGLWLAHSYIELLGGRLDVETKVPGGSTFIVGLPAASSVPAAGT